MKKLMIALTVITLVLLLSGCGQYQNPSPDYCEAGNVEGVFICEKRLTSYFDTKYP